MSSSAFDVPDAWLFAVAHVSTVSTIVVSFLFSRAVDQTQKTPQSSLIHSGLGDEPTSVATSVQ